MFSAEPVCYPAVCDSQVLKRLGKGAFGEVFKVERKKDGEIYAIKRIDISR